MTALFFLVRLVLKSPWPPSWRRWLCSSGSVLGWCVSSVVLGLVSAVLFLLALAILLLTASVEGFIVYLILAFLVSPFGLPMAALWLLGKVQGVRYFIQERVYG